MRGRAVVPVHDTTWQEPWPVISLNFLDSRRLLFTFVARSPKVALSRGASGAGAYVLEGVVLDVANGRVLATPSWPSHSDRATVIAVNDQGLVIKSGLQLTLLSPSLTILRSLQLPAPPPQRFGEEWIAIPSWTGNRVLFQGLAERDALGPWLWLDSRDLRILDHWTWTDTDAVGGVAVSDQAMVMTKVGPEFAPPYYLVRGLHSRWAPAPLPASDVLPSYGLWFVGPETVAYFSDPPLDPGQSRRNFHLASLDGSVTEIVPQKLHGWAVGRPAVSRAGSRFVLGEWQVKGGISFLDIPDRSILRGLLLFDHQGMQPRFDIPLSGSRARDPSCALSPDGQHLVLLSGDNSLIEIYTLPPVAGAVTGQPGRP